MASTNTRARRFIVAGALAVAAAAVPVCAALTTSSGVSETPQAGCLAWYGSRNDGICLSYSNGNGVNVGTPQVGIGGPNSSNPGIGITTGPLLPGQTINVPIG